MKLIIKRMKRPTPAFFLQVRKAGLIAAGAGVLFLLAPFFLPTSVLHTAGYLAVAGIVMAVVSQCAVKYEKV